MASGEDEAPPPAASDSHEAATTDADTPGPAQPRQGPPTTAVSSIDIQTLSFPDGSRGTFSTESEGSAHGSQMASPAQSVHVPTITTTAAAAERRSASTASDYGGHASGHASPDAMASDTMSIMSFAPTVRPPGDLASLAAGDFHRKSRAWTLLRAQAASVQPFESARTGRAPYALADFDREFDDVATEEAGSEEQRLVRWKAKLKHYLILSSAGKPIWSRHGDLGLVNGYMGVVQTIISFYEGAHNPLLGFTAGAARFVVVTEGPLYLVAVSRLGESDGQLRDQLRALYMQILSTLTQPTLASIFARRPSTDLRTPLQGTEGLLASLADSFTLGSPAALLGALECLRLRKAQRTAITTTFLRQRSGPLLYGLLVAGGRLVSVIRPRQHSLHPSDLQLIFNMLFESGAVQAGGGESWIPLCLPAFNSSGYLYMYVSFFDADADPPPPSDQAVAIVLISPDKEAFFALQAMRDNVAASLTRSGSLAIIRAAAAAGRPVVADLVRRPGSAVQISHFLYKSRANVQFVMSSLTPEFAGGPDQRRAREARRRLMTLYHQLHAAVHARHSHLRILHCIGEDATSLGWVTPVFEFYCVAGPNASRALVTQDANRIVQWAKREEERLFIIGGGVF